MTARKAPVRSFLSALIGPLRRRGRFAVFFFTLFTVLLTGLHLTFLNSLFRTPPPDERAPAPLASPVISEPLAAQEIYRTAEGYIKKGTGLAANLTDMGLSPAMVEELLSHLSPVLDFRRLRPGDRFALDFHPEGELRRLTYQTGPLEAVVISRDDEEWEVSERSIPSETKVATIRGTIESSLFESLEKLGEHDRLAMEFVDIFAWDIDFSHELHKGDTFRIVVEKVFRDGAFVTYGRVLAAQYRDREELHQAFSFPYPDEEGEYYSPEGKSVRRTFLRAPVSYSRISSGYSRQRLHPILKRRQPHLGVDYAAPAGTPVWAPADGKVVSKTSDRRNGRKLVLRHPNGYSTYFLHLSRFARGIKAGTKVKQKDVVGYVGSTGHSTGPHLDYRMKYNGRWLNPLRQKFPPGKPLPERYAAPFEEYKEWLTGQLETPSDTFIASLESSSD